MDPVLEQQAIMEGGVAAASAAPGDRDSLEFIDMASGLADKRVPTLVAAMVAGSVVTLILLRAAGFRFSFGVRVGGGS